MQTGRSFSPDELIAMNSAAEAAKQEMLSTVVEENVRRFHEVKDTAQKASGASQMFMALAIMSINKSLEEVADNQKTIIAFLETDKQTQLKADLIVLSDIIREY